MKQRRIEIIILLFTGLLIAAVAIIGSITFGNLKVIEKQSEKIYEPNQTVINLKLLLGELRNSENCIRSYSLYKNPEYLQAYQISLEQVAHCFDSLYFYQKGDREALILLDSTESLVAQKVILLNKQLSLRDDDRVVNELERIKVKLDKFSPTETTSDSLKNTGERKKKSFFGKLFNRKTSKKAEDTIRRVTHVRVNKASIDGVKSEVYKVKANQSKMFAEMNIKGLALVQEDKHIWEKLSNILTVLEARQTSKLKTIAEENIKQTEKTHKLTLLSGVSILILLSFLALFSIYYFYSVGKHRAKLNNAVNESRMLAKARETFLANMSHEMRTPLNAIIGFTEQLGETQLDAEQKNELDIINSASKHLLGLVNDVLDLSKIEAEKITFEKIVFNPKELISESVQFFKPKITDKNLEASLTIEKGIPESVIGDPLRLKQIILNLLSNSIKFTAQGGIKINVSSYPAPQDPQVVYLNVSIEDTGIGIPPEMVDKVFDNFVQADSSINRKFGGTGLGLSITKKIVELQGGDIKVESVFNKGTTITFCVPFLTNREHLATYNENTEKYIPTLVEGKRILIADDEAFNRALLITILKRWGVLYDEAENGTRALELVDKNNYDIILMDLRMPEISGIEASTKIRQLSDVRKSSTPIIALTAAVSEEKRKECMDAGMNDVLTKPYKEAKLLKLIEQTISKNKLHEKI